MALEDLSRRRRQLEGRHAPWKPMTQSALLARATVAYGDRPFVIDTAGDRGASATYTYAQVAAWAARVARGLVARGVAPGERVAIWLPNGAEGIAVRFGIAMAGAIAVPVNVRLMWNGLSSASADLFQTTTRTRRTRGSAPG